VELKSPANVECNTDTGMEWQSAAGTEWEHEREWEWVQWQEAVELWETAAATAEGMVQSGFWCLSLE
jgi:hypothetical protein